MIGSTIAHYRILERLGGDGMGVVYLAEDTTLGRRVALKFLPPALASSADSRERLLREARAASALNHPHICTIHEVGEQDGQPFIAMEWLDGETLKQRLERGAMPIDALLDAAIQMAEALETAHARGLVHRDLKPANLFLTRRGDAKVLDFGLAKSVETGPDLNTFTGQGPLTSPGSTVGTVAYIRSFRRRPGTARFTREAQTLASLNHSNIAQIYGIEDLPLDGGIHGSRALVMELVDGEDLSAVIARGPMPLAEVLPIATQIADALEAAHEQGIVHRDLKPANIKVRADGTVKVLDFGLAKATDPARSGAKAMHSPTLTARATQMGVILGTAAYMAPEQARGKAVDKRADIWAFGVVLSEMLTGQRTFKGEEMSDVLAAVLRQDIDWTALPPDTPPRLRRLIARCLERDVKQRLRDIGEARLEIGRVERGEPDFAPTAAALGGAAPAPARSPAILIGALVAGALLMFAADRYLGPAPAGGALGPPVGTFTQVTDLAGVERGPTLSPDGKSVVYTKSVDGDTDLYL